MKNRNRKKKVSVFCIAVMLLGLTLTGCGLSTPLAAGFDSDEVSAAAQHAVEVLNTGDLDAFHELCRADLNEVLTDDVILDAMEQVMPDAGAFEKFTAVKMTGAKDDSGEEYASVIVETRYENQKVTYTIGLDLDLLLVGFYIK